jgi:hypothetical protein
MNRRTLLAATAAAGIGGLSGCVSDYLGSTTQLESTPAGVSQSALDSTGYEAVETEERVIENTVEAAGKSETFVITNYLNKYEKPVGIEGVSETATATFAVHATSQIELPGETVNPVGELSGRDVVDLIGDRYDGINGIEHDSDRELTILEQSVTKSRFVAAASFAELSVDLDIHVTEAVERGEDFLVAVGVYPQQLRDSEAANMVTLSESITSDAQTIASTDSDSGSDRNDSDSSE